MSSDKVTPSPARPVEQNIQAIVEQVCALPYDWHGAGTVNNDVLQAFCRHLSGQGVKHSTETGTGRTTLVLSHLSQDHTVFAIKDSDSFERVIKHPLLNSSTVRFIDGPTQLTLPRYTFEHDLDFALLDGPHGFPFPDLEYYYIYPRLTDGALLVVDDIHIPTIFNLFAFLREDAMFKLVEVVATTAFFRRTNAPTLSPVGDSWWEQNYNKARFPAAISQ